MRNRKIFGSGFVIIFSIIACNFQAEQLPPAPEAQTAAALTVQAILTVSVTPTEPQAAIAVTPSPTSTAPTLTPTLKTTITPTYSVPMLKVIQQTNCRTGPGQDYEVIFTYLAGKRLEIVGRYDPDNYWLVKSAESPSGVCWLWGEYVEVAGSYWVVSSVTPPPTATLPPPSAPSLKWTYECTYNGVNDDLLVSLEWTDYARNEDGYRVFRDGEMIAELPANSTAYTDRTTVDGGEQTRYSVEAYNATGSTSDSTLPIVCTGP